MRKFFLSLFLLPIAAWASTGQYVSAAYNKGASAPPAPVIVQGPMASSNDVQTQIPLDTSGLAGDYLQACFPATTQVGNTIVAEVISASATSNLGVSDDGSTSNSYSIPTGASETAGSQTIAFYSATVSNTSRCVKLTFTSDTNAINNQMVLWEVQNLGVVDKTCAATVTSGTAPACSAMTTTVNGDFILAAVNVVSFGTKPTGFMSFTAQSGWTLSHASGVDWSAAQTITQATAGSITPTITISTSTTRANIVGIAFKAASGGGGRPAGVFLLSKQSINTGLSGWGFSNASTSTTQAVQFPCVGNDPWLLIGAEDAISVSGVTDTNSNTWAGLTRVDSTGDGFFVQWWHVTTGSPVCNGTEKVTVTFSSNPSSDDPLFTFFDVVNSGKYDSSATCGSGSTPCATNNNSCTSTTTIAGATITPSVYPSLILSYHNQDFGTIGAVNVGSFITATEACPNGSNQGCNASGTGTILSYVGPGLEQDAGVAVDTLASGSAAFSWTYANTQSTAPGACFSSTVAIKHP